LWGRWPGSWPRMVGEQWKSEKWRASAPESPSTARWSRRLISAQARGADRRLHHLCRGRNRGLRGVAGIPHGSAKICSNMYLDLPREFPVASAGTPWFSERDSWEFSSQRYKSEIWRKRRVHLII
jgi:transposase